MKKKIIGITADIKGKFYEIESFYFERILELNMVPVMLPMIENSRYIKKISKEIDGILISGSRDIDPKFYGQKKKFKINSLDIKRTLSEIAYIKEFKKNNKKILGICGGMQLLNVFFGGSLIQDIPSQIKTKINHSKIKLHEIDIIKNTLIADILKREKIKVNSFHHQCIDKLGKDLIASSRTNDEIIESIESKNKRVLGVQWHPELLNDNNSKKIFNWLSY
jgi:putative glutamine amidotransferase|tara:strand:- start:762 stop:1427 length:666 start_codon:yes stop_codon:yes gene_type:complete